jgi:hypothetical protein
MPLTSSAHASADLNQERVFGGSEARWRKQPTRSAYVGGLSVSAVA